MNIVVAGGGKVGGELVQQLSQEGHSVTVVDVSASRVEEINGQYDVMGIVGNAQIEYAMSGDDHVALAARDLARSVVRLH